MSTVTTFKSPAMANNRPIMVLNRENRALSTTIVLAEVKRVTINVNGVAVDFVNMADVQSGFFTRVRESALKDYAVAYKDGVALIKVSPVRTYSVSDYYSAFASANGGAQ